jgi:hypothetical protein
LPGSVSQRYFRFNSLDEPSEGLSGGLFLEPEFIIGAINGSYV